jgi:hypothetical protein
MSNSYRYNPRPPRAWSRVQGQCTFTDASNNVYQSVYIPLTNQTVTLAQANYEDKLLQKGNILQYKGNSSQLTKKQKYSQLAKGFGPNRTKVFATQSETYTNPNTTGLLRVNSSILPFPNNLVGQPNNISGPFQYAVPNPNGCTGFSVQDGGNLVCGTFANPCTGEIIQTGATSSVICNPASASNVPGFSTLCWDAKVQTWFPRQRYVMTNSGNKWPQGYKGFVSAIELPTTILSGTATCSEIMLSWTKQNLNCGLNQGSYNIYVNGNLYANVSETTTSYEFNEPVGSYSVYITTVSNYGESAPSNIIKIFIEPEFRIISDTNVKATRYENAGQFGVIMETTLPPSVNGFGRATFTNCVQVTASALIVGGGGGGSSGFMGVSGGAGGGGGAINYITGLVLPTNAPINVQVGAGGGIRACNQGGGASAGYQGGESFLSILGASFVSGGGGPGFGVGSTGPGGGVGGAATKTGSSGAATVNGYGGGGGGGAWTNTGFGNDTNFGVGGAGYTNNGNNGTVGGIVGGNGGSQTLTSVFLPFVPDTINTSGGAGGGGPSKGGAAGNGTGGNGNSAVTATGGSATNYGGGGGGGGQASCGGTGGNGVVIFWW